MPAVAETETLRLDYGVRLPLQPLGKPDADVGPSESWEPQEWPQPLPRTTINWGEVPDPALESTAVFFVSFAPHFAVTGQGRGLQAPAWGDLASRVEQASWINAQVLLRSVRDVMPKPERSFTFVSYQVWPRRLAWHLPGERLHAGATWQNLFLSLVDEYLLSEPIPAPEVTAEVSPDAEDFMTKGELAGEFLQARVIAENVFSGLSGIRLALQVDPDDETATPTLVLAIVTSAPSADFRAARKRFFRTLRWSGCDRLCLSLAVVRE